MARQSAGFLNRNSHLLCGMVSWWKCIPDIFGGQYWYDLVNLNVGTLNGASANSGFRSIARPGGYGSWLGDGTAGYVDLGAPASLNISGTSPRSVALWFNSASQALAHSLVTALDVTNTKLYALQWDSVAGKLHFQIHTATGDVQVRSNTVFSNGVWYFVVAVYDGANLYFYTNGKSDATPVAATGVVLTLKHANIGGFSGSFPYAGNLDDVRIWNRALSATEVQQLYQDDIQGNPNTLLQPELKRGILPLSPAAASSVLLLQSPRFIFQSPILSF